VGECGLDQVIAISTFIAALSAVVGTWIAIRNSRHAIEALEIPFLIPDAGLRDQWRLKFEHGTTSRLRMPLRNVGMGPAILGDVQLLIDEEQLIARPGGQIALPAGDHQSLPFQLEGQEPGPEKSGEMRIYYTHASGARYVTRCKVKTDSAGLLPTSFRRERSDDEERQFLFWSRSG
jgi:hypothetical protein